MNIVEEIWRRANPSAPALMFAGHTLSYGALRTLTEAASAALGDLTNQRVGFDFPNGFPHIVWSLAVLRAGGVLIPIAPELSARERMELRTTTGLHLTVCAEGKTTLPAGEAARRLEIQGLGSALVFSHAESDAALPYSGSALHALNPALVRFSSGTTGRRKGVVLSHETLLARVTASNSHLQIGPADRVIWMLPMAHHFAVSIVLYLLHGATTVLENSHLGADVFKTLADSAGTVLYAAPFHYALLASCPAAHPVSSLRLAVSTAAALPETVSQPFQQRFGLPLRQALGVIECGLPIFNDHWSYKSDSIGRPQAGYEFSLREMGPAPADQGSPGELYLKGPGFVDAYLAPWTPRTQILQEGWFRTGDLARVDADDALFLVGRTHSVINVGGMKCFPEEVEACLSEHPAVREARVAGLPHPTFGAVPVAEFVPADPNHVPKASELMAHCRTRLSRYKIPLQYTAVTALPKTPSGKIQR